MVSQRPRPRPGRRSSQRTVARRAPSKSPKPAVTHIVGIDFSGSSTQAGRLILVATCKLVRGRGTWRLVVGSVRTVDDIGGKTIRTPGEACSVLRAELLRLRADAGPGLVVGVDSPPSVAGQFVRPHSWSQWAASFTRRFPSPDAFRRATTVRRRGGSKGEEPKRETDILARVPFPPQNLRMFRQTYHAIAGLYAPLASAFAVVPCAAPGRGAPLLFESCPASVLKRLGLYKPPYKSKGQGDAAAHRAARRRRGQLLRILQDGVALSGTDRGSLKVVLAGAGLRRRLLDDAGADALDSVLAAVGAACATRSPRFPAPSDGIWRDAYSVEACVYC